MHGSDHRAYVLLEDTVRGRIRDHTASQHILMLFSFGFPVSKVGVSLLITLHDARREARLYAGGRVGAMSGSRDKKDITLRLLIAAEELTDDYETCVFSGSAGSGLQGASVKARDGE